jgi:hypothetical protein
MKAIVVMNRFTVVIPFFTGANRSNIDRCQCLNDLRVVFTDRGETNRPNSQRRTTMRKLIISTLAVASTLAAVSAAQAGYWFWNGFMWVYQPTCNIYGCF